MKDRFVFTQGVRAIEEGLNSLNESPRRFHSCDILVLWQPASGAGLSTALCELTTVADWRLVHVRAEPTPRTLLGDMFRAVYQYEGAYYGNNSTRLKVEDRLVADGRPIVVFDNCERLSPRMFDILRDMGDATGCPIAVAGGPRLREILFGAKTSLLEPVRDRIRMSIEVPRPSLKDAKLLATELFERQIDNNLIGYIFKRAGQSMRSLLRAFRDAEQVAMTTGLERIGLTDWLSITGAPAATELPEPMETLPAKRAEVA
jgi:hypothetical protein